MFELFHKFLKEITSKDNTLYILGDFFDYWIGDDHTDAFYHEIAATLKSATNSGLQIFFMRGNRDFLVSKRFAKQTGVTIINDPYYITVGKNKIVLAHGDRMCTDDKSYQIYRKWIAYNKPLRFVFRRLPLFLREKTAGNVRKTSYVKNRKDPTIDVTFEGVEKFRKDCNVVIHGHTHRMNIHHGKTHVRYVLGDWFKKGSYIEIEKDLITLHTNLQGTVNNSMSN